jgi:Na+-translocating ferredoxin:NAD+ oxidoreductase RnfC subunit
MLAEQLGLSRCIECGLCDRACPSQIPMAQLFGRAKVQQHQRVAQAQAKQHYKERYAAHNARLAEEEQAAIRKRESRLKNSGRWS